MPAATALSLRSVRSMRAPAPASRPSPRRAAATVARAATAATKQKYVCVDCGYIYTERKPGDFKNLPNDYKCPACTSTKRRFKPYKEPKKGPNNARAMANRQQEISENGSDINPALIIGFLAIAAAGAFGLFNALDAATTVQ